LQVRRITLAVVNADDAKNDAKPLTPEMAAKKIGEKCTVQMEVKSTGKGKGVVFLNSKADYKAADNFTASIDKVGVEKLKEAKIDDPAAYYKGKTVLATGMVKFICRFAAGPATDRIVFEKGEYIG
jgi:hypothetical protein